MQTERSQNTMSKYLVYNDAKKTIAKFQFKTLLSYRQYVKSNGVKNLPLDPSNIYYTKGYRTSDFLGLSEEVYKQNLKQSRIIQSARMRSFITTETHIKRSESKRDRFKGSRLSDSTVATQYGLLVVPSDLSSSQSLSVSNSIPKSVGLDPDKVISFLIDENVEPDTIVKMIADLEISSGTLMAELCKYMTKKTLEKQATWRPTGYNTAEAQMSLKM